MDRLWEMRNARVRRKILVVEDNVVNREMLRMHLEEKYDVIIAENGLVGLEQLEANHDDLALILLDVYMPVCDGFEFLRRKKLDERYDTIPVIVATASDEVADEITCLELGANDFIVKPYLFEIMMNRIGNMIRLRESASLVNQLSVDRVTGLFSKERFHRAVDDELKAAPDGVFDIVCADIENFKMMNDRYGERNCDKLLHDLAQRLLAAFPGCVAGGRVGGGALAFMASHNDDTNWDAVLAVAMEGMPYANLRVKLGIVECADHGLGASQLCNRAMTAVDTVKGLHGRNVALYDDELHERQLMEQTIREGMESALSELQFSVFYQPKHDVRAGRAGGAEALVRWFHPEIGFISPGLFIPIFERNGFITHLDLFVWEEACKEVRRCIDAGLPTVPISVNASRLDFDDPGLPTIIEQLADKYGIDHALLHVELTETAFSDNPACVATTLAELRERGFQTELDDFGAGYSSLALLNTLPLDVMKLDMSMIRRAAEIGDFRVVESTIKLAQMLGLKTVVEGVETAEEADKVIDMGCDMIQGYYYSRPLNHEDFETYLAQENR